MKSMSHRTFLAVSGIIFLVIAVLHLLRAVLGWRAVIGSFEVPIWLSWVAAVVAAYLAYSALRPVK